MIRLKMKLKTPTIQQGTFIEPTLLPRKLKMTMGTDLTNLNRLAMALLVFLAVRLSSATELPEPIIPFLDQHCTECHDDISTKGNLDLINLSFDPEDEENFDRWVYVFDRVRKGEMPPKKKKQPTEKEKQVFLEALAKPLVEVDTERQKHDGRVVFRRLNRTEYEYTLRDLLGLPFLSVREKLPADNEAHGFDTVGEALNLSYVQMTKYLETADLALGLAIDQELADRAGTHFPSETVRKTGAEIGRFKVQNGEIQHLKDTRIVLRQPNTAQTPWRLGPLDPPVDGEYKIRVSSHGLFWDDGKIKPADRSHVISLSADSGNLKRNLATFDITNDKAEVFETTVRLQARDSIIIHFDSLDDRNEPIRNKKKGLPYSGPGIACEWFELEGPLPAKQPEGGQPGLFETLRVQPWMEESGLQAPREIVRSGKPPKKKAEPLMVVSDNPEQDARRLLLTFMERAFRRPVADGEVDIYLPLVRDQLTQKRTFQDAMRTGFKAILCSPDFLFLKESKGELDDYSLASRLSYFLWKSMPDGQLLSLAAKGELSRPEVLREQTNRLLDSPKSVRFVEDFLDQWLELRRIGFTEPDKQLYPEFTELIQNSMVKESREFFAAMLRENLSADHLVRSDFTFVNAPLAKLYDIPNVDGVELRRVNFPADSPRGGFLTQGSVLKVTANGTTTSPVTRGVWIMDRLLGRPVPPPPPGAGSIDPDIRGTTTIRDQLDKHRAHESCAACHRSIDPPGFALESFDVMGGWRDRYRSLENGDRADAKVFDKPVPYKLGPPVDPSGQTADGEPFQDIEEFRELLLKDSAQLARNLTNHLMIYATGAEVSFADRADVEEILSSTASENYGTRSLVHAIIQSTPFQTK